MKENELTERTEELVKGIVENLRIPTFEDFKIAFFDEIRKEGIRETRQDVEKIFDSDNDMCSYGIYDILNQINKDFFGKHTLCMEMNSDYGIVCNLIDKLNPAIGEILDTSTMELSYEYPEYFSNEIDIDTLAEKYHDQIEKELSVKELEAFILKTMNS